MKMRKDFGGDCATLIGEDFRRSNRLNKRARGKVCLLAAISGVGALSAAASQTHAQISVTNGNFANPTLASGANTNDGDIPGWTEARSYAAIQNLTADQFPPLGPNGGNALVMNGGIIYQNLGTMIVGQTYSFDISYGWRTDIPQYESSEFAFILRPGISSSTSFVVSESPNFTESEPPGGTVTSAPLPSGTGVQTDDIFSFTATAADNGLPLTLQLQNTDLQLVVTNVGLTTTSASVDPTQLFYTGAVSGSFDSTTADNFALSNGSSAQFTNDGTKTVTFNDNRIDNGMQVSNTSVVIQAGGVLPAAVNIGTSTVNYTFTDADGINGIGGAASLSKSGSSTLFIASPNSYTGGTNISGGTVNINNNSALGSGTINFSDNATLQAGAPSVSLSNTISMGGGSTTFDTNGNTLTLSGSITNAPIAGLATQDINVIGTGTLNLSGALNVTSGTISDNTPALYMASTGTTVNITGTGTLSSISMGWAGSSNTLYLDPGAGTGTLNFTNTDDSIDVGQQGGQGAVFQTGGTLNMTGNFNLARWDSSYGSFTMTGGTLNLASSLNVGAYGAGGTLYGGNCNAYLTQSAGTINVSGNTVLVSQNAGNAVVYLTGGTYNNTGSVMIANGSGSNASLTVSGTSTLNTGSIVLSANGNGVLNLNGGTTITGSITGGNTSTATSVVNFNGGTLIASGSTLNFMSGLTTANIYAGGAIINTNSSNITISQALSSAGGSGGLNGTATLTSAGSGYIGAPIVTVTGGGGTGATAIATTNSAGGVTSVIITNPGMGYTSTPAFTFSGGGGNASGAAFTAPAPTANAADGGLMKQGGGILTLSGSNTYKGATRVQGGTLQVAGPGPAVAVVNPLFTATPVANPPGYIYAPNEPGGWNYYSNGGGPANPGAGIITNGGPFQTNGTIPVSTQAAFIQNQGAIYQTLSFPSTGTYTLSFYTEQRAGDGTQDQALDVLVGGGSGDGSPVVDVFGSNGFTPSVSWELETVTFTEQSGSHQFAIEGLNQAGDETAYVTDVNLTAPYAGGSVTNSIPAGSAVILSAGTTLDVNSSIQTIGSLNGPSGSTVTLGSGTLSVGGDNTSVTFAGSIIDGANGAGGSLTKIGSGVQTLTGSNSYTGSTNVSGGTLVIANHGALPASTPVAVGRSATLVLDSQATESGITSFNLNGNLIVHGGSLSTINADVAAGYNSGNWNGSGTGAISSTSAASDSTHLTALGVIQNSVNGSPAGSVLYSSFEGQTGLVSSDVLVKYTYYGDTNLDGKVDGSDYSRIDNGSLNQLTGWYNGDFNYDGVINGSDYTLIDNSYNTQGAEISAEIGGPSASVTAEIAGSGSSSAVPEPTALGLLCVGSVGLLRRRRVPR